MLPQPVRQLPFPGGHVDDAALLQQVMTHGRATDAMRGRVRITRLQAVPQLEQLPKPAAVIIPQSLGRQTTHDPDEGLSDSVPRPTRLVLTELSFRSKLSGGSRRPHPRRLKGIEHQLLIHLT
jgi:hypothetical protein